jgi:eukaryotic-like serine/threonine-protein kinase
MIYVSGKQSPNGATCNLWEVGMDVKTGRAEGKPRRLTNWAGFCMDSLSVTREGGRLAFKRWSAERSVYVADFEANKIKIKNLRRLPFNEGMYNPTAWTADSKAVVFDSHRNGQWGLFKLPVDENTAQLIVSGTETEEDFLCPRVSPDGEWVLYQAPPTWMTVHLMRVPITGGVPQPVLTAFMIDCVRCAKSPASLCASCEETPNHRQLVFTAFDPVKGRGPELTRFDVDDPNDFYGFDTSPDGTSIAVLQYGTGSIHILSLKGQATQTFTVKNWNNAMDWAADGKGLFVSRATQRGSALLQVDLRGNTHVLWDQPGDFEGSVGLPSPDGRRLMMTRSTFSSNMWMLENF